MRHIYVIGIGTGNPEHVTIQAINAMNAADLIFIPTKGAKKEELAEVRREICERYVQQADGKTVEFAVPVRETKDRSYVQSVDDWHAAIAATYLGLIGGLPENGSASLSRMGRPEPL